MALPPLETEFADDNQKKIFIEKLTKISVEIIQRGN